MKPTIFSIEPSEIRILASRLIAVPSVDFKREGLSDAVYTSYVREAETLSFAHELRERAKNDLYSINGRGYVIIEGLFSTSPSDFNDYLNVPTVICSLIGKPIKVMDKLGLWLDVPVKLDVEPFRFGGTGYNPFHIDVVNSTNPPDMVVFHCDRPDPLGGGQTIISNIQRIVELLDSKEIEFLQQPIFSDGMLYNMSGVGAELNPFPVLEKTMTGSWKIRFTAKMLPKMEQGTAKEMIKRFEKLLVQNQEQFLLDRGQMIIMNQNVVAHGRLELGAKQESLSASDRRLLHQMYMRFPNL